jgi:serine/threonine protein phosphatase PrpC
MSVPPHDPMWRVLGASVRGAAHLRAQRPNQDALCWLPESGNGPPVLLAVADGHGNARSFRSDRGARLATATTAEVLCAEICSVEAAQLSAVTLSATQLSAVKRCAEERLPRRLAHRWRQAVAEDCRQEPFTDVEWDRLLDREGPAGRKAVEANPTLAYGTTLLAALVTEAYLLYVQLGDGDLLTVAEDGSVARPLPSDQRLLANETTSLCSPNAWRDFQVRFQVLSQPPAGSHPALILLATDGYANAFASEAGFLQVGTDLLAMLRADGPDAIQQSLTAWLTEASQTGSGDDITLGIICRLYAATPSPQPSAAKETA